MVTCHNNGAPLPFSLAWQQLGVSYLQGMHGGMHKGMPKVNLKTYFKKIMLSLSLYCHVFSVGM
jgi:hypothetical protein